ncbi:ABC transporter substrate-binding protein [Yinghuangia aomiensis]
MDATAVAGGIQHIKSGRSTGAQLTRNITAVTAVDPATVRIDLAAPDPSLLYSLATYAGFIAAPNAIKAGNLATVPVGSGPYRLDTAKTVSGASYVLTRNPDYWNKAAYPYNQVTVKITTNASAMLNALKTGQIDGTVGASSVADAKAAGLTVTTGAPASWLGYFLNDRAGAMVPQLGDVRVRQALNHAIDRKGIAEKFFAGQATPTTQVFNRKSTAWSADLDARYPYDPAKARQLLADARAADLTLPIPSLIGPMADLQAVVQQQLADVGVTVKWLPTTPDTFMTTALGKPAYPMVMSAPLAPWTVVQNVAAPTAVMNGTKYQTPEFDALLAKVLQTTDAEQTAAFQAVNSYLVEQAWYLPVVAPDTLYFSSAKLKVTIPAGQMMPSLDDYAPAAK